jgi:hypothetical protein
MTLRQAAASIALSLPLAAPALAAEPSPHFAPLKAMVGRTWKAALPAQDAAAPKFDVQRWELALNGQAVRILHSIADGEYGGESLIVWDKEKQGLVFYYFTTAGFYTTGTVTTEGDALVTLETVKGNPDGVSQVKGVTRVLPDGRMHVKTQHLKKGAWTDGRDWYYSEAPGAEVRFK